MFFDRGVREDGVRPTGAPLLRIAIVGAGPAGLVTAIALMKRLHRPFEAWLIDAEDAPGAFGSGAAGAAATTEPARDLSVVPERPDDFADWLRSGWLAEGTVVALCRPQDLHVPRALLRDYVMARFGEALATRADVRIRTFRGHVRRVDTGSGIPRLSFRDGECAGFDHVFLATGFGTVQREAAAGRLSAADCRQTPSLHALAGLLACEAGGLGIDDSGRLTNHGEPVPAVSAVGAIASRLRPGPFTFAGSVRQAYRAVLAATPHGLARTSSRL